jgi:geranylgeranyl diphosphate/geranylgeranyl-bacteriochlorophyllide a reductase
MFDVAIVGAGPAGATLARLIGKSHRVLLLERRKLLEKYREHSPVKCCGGLLAPDAQNMLAHFGLGVPHEVLVGPQLFTVRTIDVRNGKERYYQRHYINIDRERFDRFLVSLVPSAVDIRCACHVKRVEPGVGEGKVIFSSGGREYEERARYIVAADGAASTIMRRFIAAHRFPKAYIAIQEWFPTHEALPYFSVIFDEGISDFYSWTIPKDGYLIVGAALAPGAGASRAFELLKSRLHGLGFSLGKAMRREGSFLLRPMSLGHLNFGIESLAFIGEAGGFISPTSAEGLSYAFRSALAFSEALLSGADDAVSAYMKKGKDLRRDIILKLAKMPFMYNPLLRRAVMTSGIRAMEIYGGTARGGRGAEPGKVSP